MSDTIERVAVEVKPAECGGAKIVIDGEPAGEVELTDSMQWRPRLNSLHVEMPVDLSTCKDRNNAIGSVVSAFSDTHPTIKRDQIDW